jgi:putative FmdB family regulatory protein
VGAHARHAVLTSEPIVPIYEYVCMACESHFEELVRNGEQPNCPECGEANVRRQLSVFAAHGSEPAPSFGMGGCCGGSCGCAH